MSNVRLRKRSKDSNEPESSVQRGGTTNTASKSSLMANGRRLVAIFVLGFIGHYVQQALFPQVGEVGEDVDNLTVPLKAPSAVASLMGAGDDMERYWGTYRSGYYLGMKTRSPRSPIVGLMWMRQYIDLRSVHGDLLRHKCNQDNQLRYGWTKHDGVYFGEQSIDDNDLEITTKMVKRPRLGNDGGDWSWRIEASSNQASKSAQGATFLVYFATDGDNGLLKAEVKDHVMSGLTGWSSGTGSFNVKFIGEATNVEYAHYTEHLDSFTQIHENAFHRLRRQMIPEPINKKYKVPQFFFGDVEMKNKRSETHPNQLVAFVITGDLPLTLDVVYESVSATPERPNELSGPNFDAEFELRRANFERLFAQNFNLASKWSHEHVAFAQAALSNAVGGMAYFHGHSRVQRASDDGDDYPVVNSWETPLFTGVPSRSFFPRGFLWDEGFHQLLISRFNPTLSLDAICHWLDLLNQDGWIPREQILDDEARSRVPNEFIVQRNNRANPPTLFLALDQLIDEGHVKNGELSAIYPRLVSWFNWFNTTQTGPLPSTYAWQGRDLNDYELNPKSLSSGLDDYPRATHPTSDEYHLDLRCWMALAAQVLGKISLRLGKSNQPYLALETQLKDFELLNKLHWDERNKIYADYGHHSNNVVLKRITYKDERGQMQKRMVRKVLEQPRNQFVNHSGYVSLFPLIIKIVDPHAEQLGHLLDLIRDEKRLWTHFGLRSLSQTDAAYNARNTEHDPPYWRGQIWININYLVIRALEHYASEPGPYQSRAGEIVRELKSNVVDNVFKQYRQTGFVWENYNQDTGAGQGCHPFTGWSALTVLMMKE